MIIIIEGADALGKSTQVQLIKNRFELEGKTVHILHYSNLKFSKNKDDILAASKNLYKSVFDLMINNEFNTPENILIFDRSYIGEVVYSPIYRNYSGDYVYDIENDFVTNYKFAAKNTKLILFTDSAEAVIERDKKRGDMKSFTLDIDKKRKELTAFEEAVKKSKLNKKIISLKGRSPEQIFKEDVENFIFKI